MRTLRPRKTTPRNGGHPFEGSQISEPTRVSGAPATAGWRERERNRPKRVERRQAPHGPARLVGFAPLGRAPRKREATTGSRAIRAGARDIGLVAEVGEEHPPRSRTRSSKDATGLRGSVRRSSRVVGRRREPIAARESVPEGESVYGYVRAEPSTAVARPRAEPMEGVLGRFGNAP